MVRYTVLMRSYIRLAEAILLSATIIYILLFKLSITEYLIDYNLIIIGFLVFVTCRMFFNKKISILTRIIAHILSAVAITTLIVFAYALYQDTTNVHCTAFLSDAKVSCINTPFVLVYVLLFGIGLGPYIAFICGLTLAVEAYIYCKKKRLHSESL